jgi:hypothetical protein
MGNAVKLMWGQTGHRAQYSTERRVERLRERLAVETDPRTRRVIEAQLAAFRRPPQGTFD